MVHKLSTYFDLPFLLSRLSTEVDDSFDPAQQPRSLAGADRAASRDHKISRMLPFEYSSYITLRRAAP